MRRNANRCGVFLVFDGDGVGRVERGVERIGENERDRFADVANLFLRQRRPMGGMKRIAGTDGNGIGFRQRTNAELLQRCGVDDGDDVRHGARIIKRQRKNAGMRMRRTHKHGVKRIARRKIRGEAPLPRDEAAILHPREWRHRRHGSSARSSMSTR